MENYIFIENLWNKKVFKDILRGGFDFLKNYFALGIPDLFSFKIKLIFNSW
jgi:hypothetical protein